MARKGAAEQVQESLERRIDPQVEPAGTSMVDPVPGKRLTAKVVGKPAAKPTDAPSRAVAEAAKAPPAPPAAPPVATSAAVRRVTVRRPKPKPEPPEVILVRATERGQYGLDTGIIIRNPGEVFEMATSAMRKFPLGPKEHPIEDAVIIETERGQFELPPWVELAGEDEEPTDSQGHWTEAHGQALRDGTRQIIKDGRTIDVL